ncbi:hypothetical protein THAOC_16811 [Thalassiosira oceanica]|uniref:Uncharacterized protein n=1 Tax=Thalassiosira oceanica TaxID=159749 RepID=K0SNQ1_THAOC|nr:hypothetical protein THAOC_16811 [Thalassiosira oceanica]|eukprot:EJK62571.1 hypothetical protein THAOC_16811 [Thalassiosira oceanica]
MSFPSDGEDFFALAGCESDETVLSLQVADDVASGVLPVHTNKSVALYALRTKPEVDGNFFSSDSDGVYVPEGEVYYTTNGDRLADDDSQVPFGFFIDAGACNELRDDELHDDELRDDELLTSLSADGASAVWGCSQHDKLNSSLLAIESMSDLMRAIIEQEGVTCGLHFAQIQLRESFFSFTNKYFRDMTIYLSRSTASRPIFRLQHGYLTAKIENGDALAKDGALN